MQIEIVSSTRKGFSSMSHRSREAVLGVLSKHFSRVRISIINNLDDLEMLVNRQPDLVFLGMNYIPANNEMGLPNTNKIWISEHLDEHSILYTGSSQSAHEIERNKHLAKQRAIDFGLETSPFLVIKQNDIQNISDLSLGYPVFIKPTDRGGGLGIDSKSVAHNFNQLKSKIKKLATIHQSDSLVEEFLPGREFSVAILFDKVLSGYSVMPVELISEPNECGDCLLGGKLKSANTEKAIKITDVSLKQQIKELAISVFRAIGARDYGRIDIRLDKFGTPKFLEANLIPSLIEGYGSFPKACLINKGLNYEQMILNIADLGLMHDKFNIDNLYDDDTDLAATLNENVLEPV
jgi:D-alanine-D-alanine ligase